MGQLQGPLPDFAGLFAEPSIERMLKELSDHEFEHFVGYVFEQAGYVVEDTATQYGPGLDLKLYTGPVGARTLCAGVQVKHFPSGNVVRAPDIVNLRGGVAGNGGVPGYIVTTSGYVGPALTEANTPPRVWPLDGARFLRYINYVRGTRAFTAAAPQDELSALDHALAPISPEAVLIADEVKRRSAKTTKVLTLANHKGGVGKTTTALNLAFGLAGDGYKQRVLLVDMDAQANLTKELSASQVHNGASPHLGDYFARRRTLAQLVRPTQFEGQVWLIPSDHDLALADQGVTGGPGAELRFVRDLHATNITPPFVRDERPFDWIIIDTGPSTGFFTRLALAASHYVITPIAPGVFSDAGEKILRRTMETMGALTSGRTELLGCVVTQWKDDALNRQFLSKIKGTINVIGKEVPVDRNIEKAHIEVGKGRKKPLFSFSASKAAEAYSAVIDEVVNRVDTRG
jgi:chromosome partitioning protein